MDDDDLFNNLLAAVEETTAKTAFKDDPNFLQETTKSKKIAEAESLVHTGLTDSSDDEDNRDFQETKYNSYGKSVKHQLAANASSSSTTSFSSFTSCSSSQASVSSKWNQNPKHSDNRQLQIPEVAQTQKSSEVYTDPIFGMKISNPLVSAAVLKDRMQGRQAISLMKLRMFVESIPANADWVVAGVIVHKTGRTSQKGNPFSIWTLSDMHGDLKTFSLFLFRSAYKDLWKCSVGTVVGVLNPAVFEKKQGSKDEVCRKFNQVGSNLLSRRFVQIEKRHAAIFKRVKLLLPRRESERRVHPLFRHCDILSAVETRISMLNMTYTKHIQSNMCCFIPGKVLDELDRVLNIVDKPNAPPRANEILQELRDISSMAMEFFDEKILPNIRGQLTPTTSQFTPTPKATKVYITQPALQGEIRNLTKVNKRQHGHINCLSKELQKLYMRVQKQKVRIKAQKVRIKAQAAIIQDHSMKLQEQENKTTQQDTTIAELKKHVGEWEQKLVTLTAEMVTSRNDIVKAIFPVPMEVNHNQHQPASAQTHKTVIRPRVSQVQTPNTYIVELERKRKASMDTDIPNKLRFIMKQDSNAFNLKEQVANKINENITQNIAKNIRDEVDDDTSKKKYDFTRLFSTSVDAIIRNSIGNIKARKRRHTADPNDADADVLVNLH